MRSLSRYRPMEMHCDDAASRRDVAAFIRSVLCSPPAKLSGPDLDKAVQILLEKTQVRTLIGPPVACLLRSLHKFSWIL